MVPICARASIRIAGRPLHWRKFSFFRDTICEMGSDLYIIADFYSFASDLSDLEVLRVREFREN